VSRQEHAHGGRGCGFNLRPPNVLKVLVALSFFPFLRRLFPVFRFAFICTLPSKESVTVLRFLTKFSFFTARKSSSTRS